ncbi:MAG: S8 family peptidase, partial [Anaerolineae bacterium]
MRIAPGVAPGATLYALKIFGCTGATELTDLALEWAVDPNGDGDFSDRVDVVNLSLGSAFGTREDTTALAVERASRLGVIVVASAGNSGDHYYAVGSPGVADHAVSVAAVGLQRGEQGLTPEITYFSSRGPRSGDNVLKPDIAAPGQAIASALAGTGSFGVALSGTSMAAPHVAGGMALLRQLYPNWSIEDLKALVMSTSRFPAGTGGPNDDSPYGPTRTGAGVLDLAVAAASPVFARAADEPGRVAVSFGRLEVRDAISASRQISIVNRGVQPIRLAPQVDGINPLPGATVSLNANDVMTLAAGESATVTLQLAADAAQLRHTPDTSTLAAAGTARHWIGEIAGAVVFTATAADGTQLPPLRVPHYAAVRPVATLTTTDTLAIDENGRGEIVLAGAGLDGEDPPEAYVSLVSLFELSHASEDLAPVTQGEGVDHQEYGDLRQIGVTANFTTSRPISETMLYFAVAMRGAWASPNQVEASVFLDVNRDGYDDYRLFNSNSVAYLNDKGTSDIFVTALEDLSTQQRRIVTPLNVLPASEAETRLFDGRVMILAVPVQDVALGYERSEFSYRVETRIRETSEVYDATPQLAYDIMRPAIRLEGHSGLPVMREAQAGDSFRLVLDANAAGANGSQGVLFISHQNA